MQRARLLPILLTGDHPRNASAIAQQLHIQEVRSHILPHEKAKVIQELQSQGSFVAMVGDGFNDAPALSQADIGIAMGRGAEIALESADVTLLKNDLNLIRQLFLLGHSALRIIRQNLFWAFLYNLLLLPVAAGALYPWLGIRMPPAWAAAAMALSSVSVVANSLRLKRFPAEEKPLQN